MAAALILYLSQLLKLIATQMLGKMYIQQTCGDIARTGGANHVHESDGHHFFVPIHLVVLQCSKSSSHSYPFLLYEHH